MKDVRTCFETHLHGVPSSTWLFLGVHVAVLTGWPGAGARCVPPWVGVGGGVGVGVGLGVAARTAPWFLVSWAQFAPAGGALKMCVPLWVTSPWLY